MSETTANISEIFCSWQGEGIYLGQQQIFCRFAGCNLNCDYCDTHSAKKGEEKLSLKQFLAKILQLKKTYLCRTISITGGEPLLQVDFLKVLLPELKSKKLNVYLETNGVLAENLSRIINLCDVVAMDIKLPSACQHEFWAQHREFLQVGKKNNIFVKTVVTEKTTVNELRQAALLVKSIAIKIPFVLQPASKKDRIDLRSLRKAESFIFELNKILPNIFMIPQHHKVWGVR